METKQEQVKRLQKNEKAYGFLSRNDQRFLDGFSAQDLVLLREHSGCITDVHWVLCKTQYRYGASIYRIHHSYKPEADKPVFKGYVLCEVKPDSSGNLCFKQANGQSEYIDFAHRYGCCGYVPKEKINGKYRMFNSPNVFVSPNGKVWTFNVDQEIIGGYVPSTLGWVAFKEEVE